MKMLLLFVALGASYTAAVLCTGYCPGPDNFDCIPSTSAYPCYNNGYCAPNGLCDCTYTDFNGEFCEVKLDGCANANTCTACSVGYRCVDGNKCYHTCTQCSAGQYTTGADGAPCVDCPVGTYGSATAGSGCTNCVAGKYSIATKATDSSTCQGCPVGKYSAAGSSTCTGCAVGTYGASVNATVCTSCAVGTYAASAGLTVCPTCSAGKYSITGQSYCNDCTPGRYVNGTSSCITCPLGAHSIGGQTTSCPNCGANYYTPYTPIQDCVACPASSYSRPGASTCLACGGGKTSSTGAAFLNDPFRLGSLRQYATIANAILGGTGARRSIIGTAVYTTYDQSRILVDGRRIYPALTENGNVNTAIEALFTRLSIYPATKSNTTSAPAGLDIGGRTFGPGVYTYASAIKAVSGVPIFDGKWNASAGWMIRAPGLTIDAHAGAKFTYLNGAISDSVIWVINGGVTIPVGFNFTGTLFVTSTTAAVHISGNVIGRVWRRMGSTVPPLYIDGGSVVGPNAMMSLQCV